MNITLRWLRRLLPGWGFAVIMALLAASGWWLHETERFASIAWGLTEQIHVWLGWVALAGTALYLVHHLARTWGPWRTLQRILGLALVAMTAGAFISGVLLVSGMRGGPPAWARPLHWWTTWLLTGLFAWHAAKGTWRALRRWWVGVLRGPQPLSPPTGAPAGESTTAP